MGIATYWEGRNEDNLVPFVAFKTGEQVLGGGCNNPASLSSQICKRKRPNTTTVLIVPMKEMKIQIGQIRGKKTRSSPRVCRPEIETVEILATRANRGLLMKGSSETR